MPFGCFSNSVNARSLNGPVEVLPATTGRVFTDLHELEEIPYDAVIALNGPDCVLRDGTPISRKQIPEKDFQRVLVSAQHYGFALAIETNKGIFVNELNPTVIELARLVNHPTPPVADIEKEFMGGECCQLCVLS